MNDVSRTSATLWLLDGSNINDDDLAFFTTRLSASETQRSINFTRKERQRQFLLGRMLLRIAVADITGLSFDDIRVIERWGKPPQLVFPNRHLSFANFSLSHSRRWVSCAVSTQAILGLDIEVIDPRRNILDISEMVFHPIEHFWLLSRPETEMLSAFYSLWSAKEALFKLNNNMGRDIRLLPLIGSVHAEMFQCPGLYRYQSPNKNLSIEIFSERPLSILHHLHLSGLTRSNLNYLPESCREQ
jgi:4'-phosphopantetheinyl transferase